MQQARINPAQYELLNVFSCINKEEDLAELKSVIMKFLNIRIQKEIDSLWESGVLSEENVSTWANEHMRTPYQ